MRCRRDYALGGLFACVVVCIVACTAPMGPQSCLVATEECPVGTFCDAVTQRCLSDKLRDVERCRRPIDCPDAARPLCLAEVCAPCSQIADVAAADQACRELGQPLIQTCIRSGPRKGQCGECRKSSDCQEAQRPVCIDGLCAACRAHSECSESGACNDGSGLFDLPGVEVGHCLPSERVIFIDAMRCPAGGALADGSRARPYCELAAAVGRGSVYVVAPRPSGTYAAATFSDGRPSVLIGPGRDGPALLSSVTATGSGTTLTLVDVVLSSPGTALSCQSGARLRLWRGTVQNSGLAIDSLGCDRVDVSESRLARNKGAALRLGSGTRSFRLVSSLIHDNLGSPAISIAAAASGLFVGNTLLSNGVPGQDGGAVSCEGAVTLADSLIVQNGRSHRVDGMGNPLGTQFLGLCRLSRVVVGIDAAGVSGKGSPAIPDIDNQLKLLDTPNNAACCIDKASSCEGSFDFFGGPRKLGEACDLGAHELH
jgi:hypothetical protein